MGALALSTGCLAGRIRHEAQLALDCHLVSVKQHQQSQSWMAEGCGRAVVCLAPDPAQPGSEVQCEGGGPARLTARSE